VYQPANTTKKLATGENIGVLFSNYY
jgi:hypothetical protein